MTPLVPALPLLGNVHQLATDPLKFFVDCYRTYGPVFKFRVFTKAYTVLSGVEAALFMSSKEGHELLGTEEIWQGWAAEHGAKRFITGSEGEPHKELRDLLRRGFSREALKGRFDGFIKLTDRSIGRDWAVGKCVPVVDAMQRLVFEQLGWLCLIDVAPIEYLDPIRSVGTDIINTTVSRVLPQILLKRPAYKKAKAKLTELGDLTVAKARARVGKIRDEEKVLIDDLMEAHLKHPDLMPEADLHMNATHPYAVGLDTVATTEASTIYTILKHPDVKARLLEEVDGLFSDPALDENSFMARASVLNGAIMETMRLHPVTPGELRVAKRDFRFQGHQIRKGEVVWIGNRVPHFLEEHFPNAQRFDIDRYERPRAEHHKPGVYSPFGRGQHVCLGKGLAETQMAISIGRLFHRYDLELNPPDYVLKIRGTPSPSPRRSFNVRVKGRRK